MMKIGEQERRERGAAVLLVLWGFFLVAVVAMVPFFVFGRSVPPNAIGVRQNYFGFAYILTKGYQPEGLSPGLHWQIPGISSVFLLPRDFQFVEFGEGRFSLLEIPTTDGSKVRTDVSLAIRLFDSDLKKNDAKGGSKATKSEGLAGVPIVEYVERSHGGPRELILQYTGDPDRVLRNVASKAESYLKGELSRLSTTEFYNPAAREKAALAAQEELAASVAPDGVDVFATLIQRYIYSEKTIDDQIFAKNLQDQTERMNAAASRLSGAKAETEKESALWDAKIKDLEVEGKSKASVIESEGRLYSAKKFAEADLLVAKARAEVDSAKANLLAQTEGADAYLAREMTPLLRTLKGGVVSEVDPYDINRWVEKLTGGSR